MANIYTRLLLDKKDFDANLKKAQGSVNSFATTTRGMFSGLAKAGGYVAAFVGISTSVHAAVTANMEFEKSLSSLRALTGVTAEELNYFRAEAIRMAMDSTQSATQMVEAYKLIGSQMPELLKNKTALTATAEAAVTLAEAAELDVPTAAKALTGSLNQMGQSSAHAAEYINILAAASQQGSADIPYLNKAVENAGGTASSVGIKFNELVAAIEAIAPRITDAASAGTNLRNIFLTLESSSDQKLRPSVVGLSRALDNLAAKNMDATQLTKMFGKESVTAAIAILQERDAFEQLRTGITGTNTAINQSKINTDNLAGSIDKLANSWTAFINTMSKSNDIINGAVLGAKYWVDQLNRANMSDEERKRFDNKNNFQGDADKSLERLRKRIDASVENGMSQDDAIEKELRMLNNFFPEALKYEQRINDLTEAREAIGGKYEKYWTAERKKALNDAEKNLKIAERQKYIYDYLYENLKAQKQEIIDKAKAEEEAARKAKIAVITTKPADNAPKGSTAYTDKLITEKRKELSVAVSDQDRIRINRELDELVKKRRYMDLEVKYSKPVDDLKSVKEYTNIRADLSEMTKLPEGWDKLPSLKQPAKDAKEMGTALDHVSSILGSLGGLIGNASDNMGTWALNSAANIAQMIVQLQALATAQGVASAFSAPWPASLAAVATVLATVSSIFSSLPKFESGGIVGGSSFFGDKLLARVNSGEMILNRKQQKRLYDLTETDNGVSVSLGVSRIQGSDLYLALSNYMKKTGKKL